jgi:hypothetical protein
VLAKTLVLAVSLALSLAVLEGGLRAFTPYPTDALPEVDARGFRNPTTRREDARIVVVGDSHTYGVNASAAESFPARLARLTGAPVYNMGVGSYGIYHYLVLLEALLADPPETVLVALYLANDLAFHCGIARSAGFREIARARGIEVPSCGPHEGVPRDRTLRERSALLDVVASLLEPAPPPSLAFEVAPGVGVSKERVRRHARATSLADARIARSHRNAKQILREAAERFHAMGVGFGVLLVPSRERVVASWSMRSGSATRSVLGGLVASQDALADDYATFFEREGIPYVDALAEVRAAFREAVAEGRDFYPPDDGHPVASGYAAYARAAARLVALTEDGR